MKTAKKHIPIMEQLRAAVERSGLTQTEIARRAGMHAQDVNRALRDGANPTAVTIDKIMRACAGERE